MAGKVSICSFSSTTESGTSGSSDLIVSTNRLLCAPGDPLTICTALVLRAWTAAVNAGSSLKYTVISAPSLPAILYNVCKVSAVRGDTAPGGRMVTTLTGIPLRRAMVSPARISRRQLGWSVTHTKTLAEDWLLNI